MTPRFPDIALVGRAQVGKDTAARHLATAWGYNHLAFADALRSMALAIDPIVAWGETEDRPIRYSEVVDLYGYEGAKRSPEVRRFLQVLGTEGVRNHLGPDAWVDIALRKADECARAAVFSDARFPNEADAVRQRGGLVIRIIRADAPDVPAHASESAMDDYGADALVVNDGSLTALYVRLDRVLAALAPEVFA